MNRATWLADKREEIRNRYDRVYAIDYDLRWGVIDEVYRRSVERVVASLDPPARVLDAGCGTGKYWPLFLRAGLDLEGIDISAEMLRRLKEKYSWARPRLVGVQEMEFDAEFDAVICIDVLYLLPPEDWPEALTRIRRALKPGGIIYFTVDTARPAELQESLAVARAHHLPAVYGEMAHTVGYRFHPTAEQLDDWLEWAELVVVDQAPAGTTIHYTVVA